MRFRRLRDTRLPIALAWIGSLGALPLGAADPGVRFEDRAVQSGLAHRVVFGPDNHKRFIIETTGTGVAVLDYDGDGIEDLYFANGSTVEQFKAGKNPTGWLYRGNGDGSYSDRTTTAKAGVAMWGAGAFPADYDNDGNVDLYLTALGQNALLRNRGDGTFENVTAASGLGDRRWSLGAAWADVDRDGHPDIYVTNYVDYDVDHPPQDGRPCTWRGLKVMCGPMGLPGAQDAFYRNRGDGTFEDQSVASGLVDGAKLFGMGTVWFDVDGDNRLDLFVANDSVPNLLFRQVGPLKFEDQSLLSGTAYNEAGKSQASMGVAVGDHDGDGDDDLFTTNFALDTNTLHVNDGKGFFLDQTDAAALGAPSYLMLAWSTGFFDFDNDGDLDLYVANGHVYPEVEATKGFGTYRQVPQLFANNGKGRYTDLTAGAGPGFASPLVARGGAYLDSDGDGRLDVVLTQNGGPAALLRNLTTTVGGWLELELEGGHCARDPIGARVTLVAGGRRQARSQVYAQGYLSSPSRRLHFGLGSATAATASVRWPCGKDESLGTLVGGAIYQVREGRGAVARAVTRRPAKP